MEREVQAAWLASGAFEADAEPGRRKFMVTFPYPYMNGRLHLGHAFSLTKAEFTACFRRLRGDNVLFPFGFHCTGMPIQAAANKLKAEVAAFGDPPQFPTTEDEDAGDKREESVEKQMAALAKKGKAKKAKVQSKSAGTSYQWHALQKMGIPEHEISSFQDANKWLDYFPPYGKQDLLRFGTSVDFRRSFITTDRNAFYDSFVRWQFHHLRKKDKISFGKRANVYSVRDGQVCADHDRATGEGVGPQEYVIVKLRLVAPFPERLHKIAKKHKKIYLAPATLRPETMYGQTNCFVLPDGEYGLFETANGDVLVTSQRSAIGMAHQGSFTTNGEYEPYFKTKAPQSLATVKGWDLLGAAVRAPLQETYDKVYVLPLETISMSKGTGVVTSVPSDAPDDWIALHELKVDAKLRSKYPQITDEMVVPYEVIPVVKIDVPGEWSSEKSAEYWCEKLEISSQKDKVKLAQAKKETYLHGFNNGTMVVGAYEGRKVPEAKLLVKQDLLSSNDALLYFEPEEPVISRSGDECIVAHTDQWYLKYGEEKWRSAVEEHVSSAFTAYNAENLARFKYTLSWMKEWACSRLFGLGTKIPWDQQWVIESLSDSTIYMAYYAVAHFLQAKSLDGRADDDFPLEALTEEVWDYIFLTTDSEEPPCVDSHVKSTVKKMRAEFRYWYPMDLRVSGKDLIGNHLTMCLYNHAAIWDAEPALWPRSMYCNGFVLLDNEKMSKSTGNFLMLEEACELYSADAVRFALADAGDTLEDANFSRKRADAAISMLFVEEDFARKASSSDGDSRHDSLFMDRAFANELNKLANETTECFEQMRWRDGMISGVSGLQNARDAYREWCYKSHVPMRRDLLRRFVELQAILIAPICPHFAEHVWANVLRRGRLGAKGRGTLRDPAGVWPVDLPVDNALSRALQFLTKSARNLRLDVIKEAKKKKNLDTAYVYVTPTYPDWKVATLKFMRDFHGGLLNDKKAMLAALKADPQSPCVAGPFTAKTKLIMQFASFMQTYAEEIGLDALEDTLPFDQNLVLKESSAYLENTLLFGHTLKVHFFDLSHNSAPGPDKAKQLADPGKPSIHVFSSSSSS